MPNEDDYHKGMRLRLEAVEKKVETLQDEVKGLKAKKPAPKPKAKTKKR